MQLMYILMYINVYIDRELCISSAKRISRVTRMSHTTINPTTGDEPSQRSKRVIRMLSERIDL